MASSELIAALTAYVKPGAAAVSSTDEAFIESCLDEAVALVDIYAGTAISSVPVAVLQRAYVEVGSELYNRRSAPNGISQFTSADGSAIRVARNPMVGAYPILQPFLPGGFA